MSGKYKKLWWLIEKSFPSKHIFCIRKNAINFYVI